MIEIENLFYSAGGKDILKNISGEFLPGKIHGIIGPNGAGKSTLMKNICRIWKPTAGTVKIDRKDFRTLSRGRLSRMVTMVPQDTHISFPISVYDIVSMGRHSHLGRFQALAGKDRDIIEDALKTCGVWRLRRRNINELSGGECQLAVIARALATEASLILLDEPTSDLDIHHALTITEILEKLRAQGKTILVNLHDLNLAQRLCDTIAIMDGGVFFCRGTPDQVFRTENIRKVFRVGMKRVPHEDGAFLHFFKEEGGHGNRSR